jgi:hypothetical protein
MNANSEQPRLELNAETGAAATLDIYAEARKDFDEAGVTRNAIARKIKRLMSWKETKVFQPRGDIFLPLPPGQPEAVAPGPVVSEKKKGRKRKTQESKEDQLFEQLSGVLIYSRPLAAGDIQLRATELAAKLRGEIPPNGKIEHTFPKGIPILNAQLSSEEMKAILAAEDAYARTMFGTGTNPEPKP